MRDTFREPIAKRFRAMTLSGLHLNDILARLATFPEFRTFEPDQIKSLSLRLPLVQLAWLNNVCTLLDLPHP
jgi:hypothetical protein